MLVYLFRSHCRYVLTSINDKCSDRRIRWCCSCVWFFLFLCSCCCVCPELWLIKKKKTSTTTTDVFIKAHCCCRTMGHTATGQQLRHWQFHLNVNQRNFDMDAWTQAADCAAIMSVCVRAGVCVRVCVCLIVWVAHVWLQSGPGLPAVSITIDWVSDCNWLERDFGRECTWYNIV